MDISHFLQVDLDQAERDAILGIYHQLQSNYDVSIDQDVDLEFKRMEVFRDREISSYFALRVNTADHFLHIVFILISYTYGVGSKYLQPRQSEYQTWVMRSLDNKFGHILIKKETTLDKMMELVNPVEVDFGEDKEFSKKFYVVSDNEGATRSFLNNSMRSYLMKIDVNDFIIEIFENNFILGDRKIVNVESAMKMVRFLARLPRNI